LRPRVLRDVSTVDPSTEFLGRKLRLPIMLCPVGSLESFHSEGAAPVVKAAGGFGIAHMLSSVCDPGLEGVAKAAPDALRIFQLYVRGDAAWVDDYVTRAIANGYAAFCLTVDTALYSRRERDIAKRHITGGRRRASGREFQARLDWRTVERIKAKFAVPLAIKGIATAEDAKIALDHGVDFVYVSNHGGRQLDHGRGSMDVLPEVAEAVAGRAKIIIDGGFYRGSDIVKAIALGAHMVGLGRMQCYGLAANGEAGIVRMLELLEDEVIRTMGLLGVTSLGKLDQSYLHAATPTHPPHVFSAFPHLDIAPYRY
jgi:isopentenyl diphosphate isomerase/L-lactate dehydrogenase-like FMN-dependent dehydrogenase